jgi:hypothetical protein
MLSCCPDSPACLSTYIAWGRSEYRATPSSPMNKEARDLNEYSGSGEVSIGMSVFLHKALLTMLCTVAARLGHSTHS